MTREIAPPVPSDTSGDVQATLQVPVHGMTCPGCAKTVHQGLSRLQGVERVSVDAAAAVATVTGDVDEVTVRQRVTEMGYDLSPTDEDRSWSVLQLAGVVAAVVLFVALGLWAFTQVSGAVAGTGAAQATFERVSPVAFGLAFVLGLAAAFAPSSLAMTPAVVGAVLQGHAHSRRRAAALAVAFVGGVLVVDALIGAVFAAGGHAAISWLEARLAVWFALMFLVLAVLAVIVLGLWRPSMPSFTPDLPAADSLGGAFAAGVPFGLLACPSCTPLLLPVILGAVATGSPLYGATILAAFGLGRGLPLVAIGTSAGATRTARSLRRYVPVVEKTVGVLLSAGALYFLWAFAITVADRGLL
ncbi:MAG: cation transporter [Actinobacteria bacterium]|nr:cation transporter [Actinomycetota bacterium]